MQLRTEACFIVFSQTFSHSWPDKKGAFMSKSDLARRVFKSLFILVVFMFFVQSDGLPTFSLATTSTRLPPALPIDPVRSDQSTWPNMRPNMASVQSSTFEARFRNGDGTRKRSLHVVSYTLNTTILVFPQASQLHRTCWTNW